MDNWVQAILDFFGIDTYEDTMNMSEEPPSTASVDYDFIMGHEVGSGKYDSKVPHLPPGSGITLGAGYDISSRKDREVYQDMINIGLPENQAKAISAYAGKTMTDPLFRHELRFNPNLKQIQLTDEQEKALFSKTVQPYEKALDKLVKVPLSPNEKTAVLSLLYNIGEGVFSKSKALASLNKGDKESFLRQAFDPVIGFVKAEKGGKPLGGLVKRRQIEKELFLASN